MRNVTLAVLLLLAAACRMGRAARVGPTATADVQAAHTRWFEGILQENVAALDTLLVDDMTFHNPGGGQGTKAAYLDVLRTGQLTYDAVAAAPATVRLHGSTAVVTGRVDIRYRWEGTAQVEKLTYTAVYGWTRGGWRMLAWQSTHRPD